MSDLATRPILQLARDRRAAILPVDGDELGKFVGTRDDARQRLEPRHLGGRAEAERDGTSCDLVGGDLWGQFGDKAGDFGTPCQ